MGGKIALLDEATVNKIAAGEVIERPSSVVKELVENSIDADAHRIVVRTEDGGERLISVSDDGEGMSREDAELCLERHATSKVRSVDDIFHVSTLGFRGEAIPSIAAVSRLTIITAARGSEVGTIVRVEGGRKLEVSDHPAAPGTSVTAADLFFNTPARLKFLKSQATEGRRIADVVMREALAHPEISFTLEANGRRVLFTSGSGDLHQTTGEALGVEVANGLIEVDGGSPQLRIHGFLSKPTASRASRRDLVFVVNGRPVNSPLISAAVARAYGPALPKGVYPSGILSVVLDAGEVDVNVHPAKSEVRFKDEQLVFNLILRTVSGVVRSEPTPSASIVEPTANFRHSPLGSSRSLRLPGYGGRSTNEGRRSVEGQAQPMPIQSGIFAADRGDRSAQELLDSFEPRATSGCMSSGSAAAPGYTPVNGGVKVLGQLLETYIVADAGDALILVDQHGAAERLAYDRLVAGFQAGGVEPQIALIPDTIELTPFEAGLVDANTALLARVGFELELFGLRTYLVRSVPAILDPDVAVEVLHDIIRELASADADDLGDCEATGVTPVVDHICKMLACKRSVKAHHELSMDEMTSLVETLLSDASMLYCPHGRPVLARLSREEIERIFGRR